MAYVKLNNRLLNTDAICYVDTFPATLITIGTTKGIIQISLTEWDDIKAGIIACDNFKEITNFGYINLDAVTNVWKTNDNCYSIKFGPKMTNLLLTPSNTAGLDDSVFAEINAYVKSTGGGGAGGTTNYEALSNKPKIAGITLSGNRTLDDLGIAASTSLSAKADKTELTALKTSIGDKADKTELDALKTKLDDKADTTTVTTLENKLKTFDTTLATKADKTELDDKADKTELTTLETSIDTKQNKLIAGANITITGDTISAVGGGQAPDMSNYYTKTEVDGLIPADTDTTYTAGNGLTLTGTEFAIDDTKVATVDNLNLKVDTTTYDAKVAEIENTLNTEVVKKADVEDTLSGTEGKILDSKGLASALDTKQDKLTAGTNIAIFNNTIKATGVKIESEYGLTLLNESDFSAIYNPAVEFDINTDKEIITSLEYQKWSITPDSFYNAPIHISNTISFDNTKYSGFVFDPMTNCPIVLGWEQDGFPYYIGMWNMNKSVVKMYTSQKQFSMVHMPSGTYDYQEGDLAICYLYNEGSLKKLKCMAVRGDAIIANSTLTYTINNGKTLPTSFCIANRWDSNNTDQIMSGTKVIKGLVGIKADSKYITEGISDTNVAELVQEYKKALINVSLSNIKINDKINISANGVLEIVGGTVAKDDSVVVYQDANQSIKQNTLVIHANKLYIAKANIDATAGWATDESEMEAVDTDTLFEDEVVSYDTLAEGETIKQGKLVIHDDKLYICKTEFAKTASFDDDQANLIHTDVAVDLSEYYKKTEVDASLATKASIALPQVVDGVSFQVGQLVRDKNNVNLVKLVKEDITAYSDADADKLLAVGDTSMIGDLGTLTTTAKDTIVGALNELKTSIDGKQIPDMSQYYNKTEIDGKIPDMSQYYSKAEVDAKITDLQNQINAKASVADIYTVTDQTTYDGLTSKENKLYMIKE